MFIRNVEDTYDNDCGWELVYDGDDKVSGGGVTTDDLEPTGTTNRFRNRIVINRNTDTGERFCDFRELQVMVKLFGICAEVVDLTVKYNLKDQNE